MNIAYVEMIGGASGNMLLGACVDAGADLDEIEAQLRTLRVDSWTLERRRVVKCGVAAQYVDFVIPGDRHAAGDHGPECGLADVLRILEDSGLGAQPKARARAVYLRLARAEATAHGTTVDAIHFHEVGTADAILDVAATCIALDLLDVEEVTCSAFPVGRGMIGMTHGHYPNPPPATAELLRGAPTYDGGVEAEMVTPTGAALLATLVAQAGIRPAMRTTRIGYGAGRSDFAIPNVTRISLGTRTLGDAGTALEPGADDDVGIDDVGVLEANIDDMSPQRFELALDRALAAGAYDVWLAPVTMKKSRPGIIFGALAPPSRVASVARAILSQTTTLGVRIRHERRYALRRTVRPIQTPLGIVRIKETRLDGETRRTLEYDDVVRIARERDLPFAAVVRQLEALLETQ